MDMAKALLIVEGANLEPRFFERMSEVCGLNVEIVPLRANIYRLYQKLEEYGFDYDVRIALREVISDQADQEKLRGVYSYTYLVFDCDAHHCGLPPAGEPPRGVEDVVRGNYDRLNTLLNYFNDETDPERGRLFVNYPMMESYRDCDSFFDVAFRDRVVRFDDLADYKRIVGHRKMASCRIDGLSGEDFRSLARMNLFKLSFLTDGEWRLPDDGIMVGGDAQTKVLSAQKTLAEQCVMSVINTSLFLMLDYRCLDI